MLISDTAGEVAQTHGNIQILVCQYQSCIRRSDLRGRHVCGVVADEQCSEKLQKIILNVRGLWH